jgi:hypothetical protein
LDCLSILINLVTQRDENYLDDDARRLLCQPKVQKTRHKKVRMACGLGNPRALEVSFDTTYLCVIDLYRKKRYPYYWKQPAQEERESEGRYGMIWFMDVTDFEQVRALRRVLLDPQVSRIRSTFNEVCDICMLHGLLIL